MNVSPEQRHKRRNPCPICGGGDDDHRGQGIRCAGFTSEDGQWARCQQVTSPHTDERTEPAIYIHKVYGACDCGADHHPAKDARQQQGASPAWGVVADYVYLSADGDQVFKVTRREATDPITGKTRKAFTQARYAGNGRYQNGLDNIERVLYRLPELLKADPSLPVYIVEGEKCADYLAAAGCVATTASGGALKWHLTPNAREYLRGRHVVILPDNDGPSSKPAEHYVGQRHAKQVAEDLAGVAASVRVLELPGIPPKGDVVDWLKAGGTRAKLDELAAKAPLAADWKVPGEHSQETARPAIPGVLLSDVQRKPIRWLWRGRLAHGKPAIFDGDPGLGKSFLTVDIVARVTRGDPMPGETERRESMAAIMITPEDDPADTVKPRLDALGADTSRVRIMSTVPALDDEGRTYERPLTIPRDVPIIEEAIKHDGAGVLVIDPITGCLDAGVKSHVDAEVRMALTPLVMMAQRTGVVVIMVRHLNKGGGEKAIYRGGGSIAFVGVCRTAFLLAEHPDNGDKRVLAQTKNNIAHTARSVSFQLAYPPVDDPDAVPHIVWDADECDYDANALLSARKSDERREIVRALKDATGLMSPAEVAQALGTPEKSEAIRQRLSRMRKAGEVISPEYGKYGLPVTPSSPVTHVTVSQFTPDADGNQCDSVTGVTPFSSDTDVSHLPDSEWGSVA